MSRHESVTAERIVVSVSEERGPAAVRRLVRFGRPSEGEPRTLSYTFGGDVLPPPLARHDFAVVALIGYAMRAGADLHVAGPVSRVLLERLEEYQFAWAKWRPDLYRKVRLSAEEEVAPAGPADDRAVLAYSGGLDANFSLLRHVTGEAGRQAKRLEAAVLIHGFDVALSQTAEFAAARARAAAVLAPFGVPLSVVETDWKAATRCEWEMEFPTAVAACLLQFAGVAPIGLFASGEDYGSLSIPWGSNPITNPLLDAGDARLETDGTGYSRSEKAALVGRHAAVKDSLRVCWQAVSVDGGNCGRCEKCVRTKLNFLANGMSPPASLGPPPTPAEVAAMRVRNHAQLGCLQDILATARRAGRREPWVQALRVAIGVSHLRVRAYGVARPVRAAYRLWARRRSSAA